MQCMHCGKDFEESEIAGETLCSQECLHFYESDGVLPMESGKEKTLGDIAESDFFQAGVDAREAKKKKAIESAQEWIDDNPEWEGVPNRKATANFAYDLFDCGPDWVQSFTEAVKKISERPDAERIRPERYMLKTARSAYELLQSELEERGEKWSYVFEDDVDVRVMAADLLQYSFQDVESFNDLSISEKKIIGNQKNFDRLLSVLREIDRSILEEE